MVLGPDTGGLAPSVDTLYHGIGDGYVQTSYSGSAFGFAFAVVRVTQEFRLGESAAGILNGGTFDGHGGSVSADTVCAGSVSFDGQRGHVRDDDGPRGAEGVSDTAPVLIQV